MCPDHVYESRSGKIYCTACNERRKAERRAKHGKHHHDHDEAAGVGSSLEALTGAPADAEDEERELEKRVLGKREPVQPWQLCMYSAVGALLLALLLLFVPGLRRIPLGGTDYLHTPYILVIIPMIAVFWGVYGVINLEFYKYRPRCFVGLGIAALSIVMFIAEVASDPATRQEGASIQVQERREVMNEQQLEGWRENVLDKYR